MLGLNVQECYKSVSCCICVMLHMCHVASVSSCKCVMLHVCRVACVSCVLYSICHVFMLYLAAGFLNYVNM